MQSLYHVFSWDDKLVNDDLESYEKIWCDIYKYLYLPSDGNANVAYKIDWEENKKMYNVMEQQWID